MVSAIDKIDTVPRGLALLYQQSGYSVSQTSLHQVEHDHVRINSDYPFSGRYVQELQSLGLAAFQIYASERVEGLTRKEMKEGKIPKEVLLGSIEIDPSLLTISFATQSFLDSEGVTTIEREIDDDDLSGQTEGDSYSTAIQMSCVKDFIHRYKLFVPQAYMNLADVRGSDHIFYFDLYPNPGGYKIISINQLFKRYNSAVTVEEEEEQEQLYLKAFMSNPARRCIAFIRKSNNGAGQSYELGQHQ